MPTLPPEEPHQARKMAESFGIDAERYDRTRPHYPDALVQRLLAASPGRDILDVGAGTGIAARQFQAAGCTVLGVEPDDRMADYARKRGLDVEVATFETWDPAGRTFDAAIAATAWHWIDPVAGAAKAAQALRPAGRLAAFWNAAQLPPVVADAFGEVYRRVVPDSPFRFDSKTINAYQPVIDKTADAMRQTGAFGEPEQWRFDWECVYTKAEWLDQLPTQGALTQLPPDKLAEVLAGVGAAIDLLGSSFTMPYRTVLITAARTQDCRFIPISSAATSFPTRP